MSDIISVFLVVLGILFFLTLVSIVLSFKKTKRHETYERYESDEKAYFHAYNGSSSEKISETISRLESSSAKAGPAIQRLYHDDILDLRERQKEIETEKWQREADQYLDRIYVSYDTIKNGDFSDFRDVENLFKEKDSCLRSYMKYFSIGRSPYELRTYMQDFMGSDYEPCFDSYQGLEKRLAELTNPWEETLKRKKKLLRLMVNYVAEGGTIKRGDFLKVSFDGYTDEEIKICYRKLIKENRLVEIKNGSYVVISLSDAEKKRKKIPLSEAAQRQIFLGVNDLQTVLNRIQDKYTRNTFPHYPEHKDLEEEKRWYAKAGRHLEKFRKCYLLVTDPKYNDLDGELLLKLKKMCIDEWQSYFAIDLDEFRMIVYPKRYLRTTWMGSEYDPCMEDHATLERKLERCVKLKRPESRSITAQS